MLCCCFFTLVCVFGPKLVDVLAERSQKLEEQVRAQLRVQGNSQADGSMFGQSMFLEPAGAAAAAADPLQQQQLQLQAEGRSKAPVTPAFIADMLSNIAQVNRTHVEHMLDEIRELEAQVAQRKKDVQTATNIQFKIQCEEEYFAELRRTNSPDAPVAAAQAESIIRLFEEQMSKLGAQFGRAFASPSSPPLPPLGVGAGGGGGEGGGGGADGTTRHTLSKLESSVRKLQLRATVPLSPQQQQQQQQHQQQHQQSASAAAAAAAAAAVAGEAGDQALTPANSFRRSDFHHSGSASPSSMTSARVAAAAAVARIALPDLHVHLSREAEAAQANAPSLPPPPSVAMVQLFSPTGPGLSLNPAAYVASAPSTPRSPASTPPRVIAPSNFVAPLPPPGPVPPFSLSLSPRSALSLTPMSSSSSSATPLLFPAATAPPAPPTDVTMSPRPIRIHFNSAQHAHVVIVNPAAAVAQTSADPAETAGPTASAPNPNLQNRL